MRAERRAVSDAGLALFSRREWIHYEGLYAWLLAHPRHLVPRPTVGKLGLFEIPDRLIVPV